MKKILNSATAAFNINVPYKLIDSGQSGKKPLIVYLHGYKQNIEIFEKKIAKLFSINAYHLLLQGPYSIYDEKNERKVAQWGRAWYLYDGEQEQFLKSMEKSAQFIQKIIDKVLPTITINRVAVIGYSMGGYLAGYFGLSRPGLVNDLVVIGGRIKTEHFLSNSYKETHVLALHGTGDSAVAAYSAQQSCEALAKLGADVTYKEINEGHNLSAQYLNELKKWLILQGYSAEK